VIEIPTEQIVIAIGGLYALNIAMIWRIAGIYREIGYIRGKISACLGDDPDGKTKGKIPKNT